MQKIHKHLHITSVILLIILGIAALAGGGAFIYDPSGGALKMPVSFLDRSPFTNYLIPGIVLFGLIGVGSTVVAVLTLKKIKYYELYIALKGAILMSWIIIQVIMIGNTSALQPILFIYGLVVATLGLTLYKIGFKT